MCKNVHLHDLKTVWGVWDISPTDKLHDRLTLCWLQYTPPVSH